MALFPVPDTYSAHWESGARQHEPGGLTGRWKERTETAESLNLPGLLCVTCRCYSQRLSKPPPRENVIPTLTRWTGFFHAGFHFSVTQTPFLLARGEAARIAGRHHAETTFPRKVAHSAAALGFLKGLSLNPGRVGVEGVGRSVCPIESGTRQPPARRLCGSGGSHPASWS